MNLRAAIGWSVAFHLALLKVYLPHGIALPAKAFHPIEVVVLPEEAAAVRETPAVRGIPAVRETSTVRGEPVEPRTVRTERGQTPLDSRPLAVRETPTIREIPSVRGEPVEPRTVSIGVSILPEEAFTSLQHKKQIREHLRAYLRYPEISSPGTVRLHLTLHPDGRLREARVMETSDPGLAEAALDGARSADPYPSFSKEKESSDAEYEFLVQYRPE